MKLVSNKPHHRANLPRQNFDMSHTLKFTSSVGHLIPVLSDFLLAGDKVNIKEEMFTRTQTLQTSAFVDIRENIDYFFVPMTQIFSLYPQWRFGVGVPVSAIFDPQQQAYDTFPSFRMADIIDSFESSIWSVNMQYPQVIGGFVGLAHLFEPNFSCGAARLLNMLGYGRFNVGPYTVSRDWEDLRFNPVRLCAYQKIFYDYYCLDERTSINNICYNLDPWYGDYSDAGTASQHAQEMIDALKAMCTLRYVPWKSDYFMGMFVNPLETPNSRNTQFYGDNLLQITDFISNPTPAPKPKDNIAATSDTGDNPYTQVGSDYQSTTVSGLNAGMNNRISTGFIRKMFALEKLLSITKRAKDDYASQVLAHYGYEMSDALSSKVMHIGGTSSRIVINDVVGTVNNDNTELGEIAGKGVGYKNAKNTTVKFTAPCDGILMGIYYARPEIDYRANGLDRQNTFLRPSDLYTAEYSNLGFQPVFAYETDNAQTDEESPFGLLGWQYRYSEYKTKINKVYTGFMEDGLSDWTVAKFFDYLSFSSNTQDFYCDPSSLDSIMLWQYKSIPVNTVSFQTDPLLHYFSFDYYKSSVMDEFGLPKL